MNRPTAIEVILNAAAAASTGSVVSVADYRNVNLQIGTASSANLTVKIQGSFSDTMPTFSSAATVSNHWDYIACYDLNTGLLVAGDTGFVVTGTDDVVNYKVNTDGLKWLCATVTARSAGSVTVKADLYDNK